MSDNEKLALFGGEPLVDDHKSLRLDWPIVDRNDFRAVAAAFNDRDFNGRGSKRILELEKRFSEYHGGLYATALNSGTAALHLALVSLGIESGDEVIVPALSFVATAMSVVHNQSIPVFADIDRHTYNILPGSIEEKITEKTRAVIVVHLHGLPADLDPIIKICRKYKLKLIEDVAQAPGATYQGQRVGTFGDASIFSLMSQKNIPTCGEAGILLNRTRHEKNSAEMARIYGEIIKSNMSRVYNSFTLGWNYTLNPIQAAMAITQLKKFPKITKKIQLQGKILNKHLTKFPWIEAPNEPENISSVFHFYRFGLNAKKFGFSENGKFRKAIQDILNAEGLNVRHYQMTPLPGHPFFAQAKFKSKLPWVLQKKDYNYDIADYPNTLSVLNNTLVLGAISSSPGYLLCPGTIDKYISGFEKIDRNMDAVLKYARNVKDPEPWRKQVMISDSFQAKYELLSKENKPD